MTHSTNRFRYLTASLASRTSMFILLIVFSTQLVAAMPAGFTDSQVGNPYIGLPVSLRFAADDTLFVGLKDGRIMVQDNVTDTTPQLFVDISSEVMAVSDQGMLGLAVHPDWANKPYVYAVYTVNNGATHGARLTRWTFDEVTSLPVSGSRVDMLNSGWCFTAADAPYASHSIGDIRFGPDGALYLGAGDGANYDQADVGQFPVDLCDDPENEGGALRTQDLETSGDVAGYGGAIIRINAEDGSALSDNPFFSSTDPQKQRIIAYGLRNPFRFAVDQASGELWVPDNGWSQWEEVNYIADPTDAEVENFGWPCYEGEAKQQGYDALDNPLCEALYLKGTATAPFVQLKHDSPDDAFSSTGAIIYNGNAFPAEYSGALFFADLAAAYDPNGQFNTIRVIFRDENGNLDASSMSSFVKDANVGPVDLQVGLDGAIYYLDYSSLSVRRISYGGPNASIIASATSGDIPLTVVFNASNSIDFSGGPLTYAWDLDNDGQYDDGTTVTVSRTFTSVGIYTIGLRVTDSDGITATTTVSVNAGAALVNQPPVITIDSPIANFTYAIGQNIAYSGSAIDPDGLAIPSSLLEWRVALNHCQPYNGSACHPHPFGIVFGPNGSLLGPEHENPSFISIQLTAREQAWWNNNYVQRKLVLLDTSSITEPLVNVPVLVTLTSSTFDYAKARADGGDIRFIDANNQELAYEIDVWNPAGTSTVWVKFPLVTPDARVGAWLYYSNAAATTTESPTTVWSEDYVGVYHLSAATGAIVDETGTSNGIAIGAPAAVAGINGPAIAFDGINDYIDTQNTASIGNADWSISLWSKLDSSIVCIDGRADDVEGTNLFVKEWDYRIYLKESCKLGFITRRAAGDPLNAQLGTQDTDIFEVGSSEDYEWHSVVYQYRKDINTVESYFDGVKLGTNNTQTSIFDNQAPFTIGGGGGNPMLFHGLIDEVTLSTQSRSGSWYAAKHAMMTGTFVTLGAEQSFGTTTVSTAASVVLVYPRTINMTFDANLPGLNLTLYGREEAMPTVAKVTVNGEIAFSAPASQIVNNTQYVFSSWSNGGARSQIITVGSTNINLVANYVPARTQLLITTAPGNVSVFMGVANQTAIGITDASGILNLTLSLPSSPASYVLRFERKLYQTEFVPIQITAGEQRAVPVTMKPNGTVQITDAPEDSTVFVNGIEQSGTAPMNIYLLPGNYTIRVSKSGFTSAEEFIEVLPNSEQTVSISLTATTPPRRSGGGGGGGSRVTPTTPFVSRLNATNTSTSSVTGGSSVTKPTETATVPSPAAAACTSVWSCSEWTACADGAQSRSCEDSAKCTLATDKPLETRACEPLAPSAQPSPLTGQVTGTSAAGAQRGSAWLLVAAFVLLAGAVATILVRRNK